MSFTLRALALPVAVVATLALTSCGTAGHEMSSGSGTTAGSAPAGAAAPGAKSVNDVDFSTMMIPHHAQAIAMADLAEKQATDPALRAMAPKISAAQGPEISRMSGWLKAWGAPQPAAAGAQAGGMAGMPGMGDESGSMMSAKEMASLSGASGPAFDRMWTQLMIRHHQGAVAMARTELARGTNPESIQLAHAIVNGQTKEIAELNAILARLPG